MPGSTTLANYRALAGPMQEREVYAHLSRFEADTETSISLFDRVFASRSPSPPSAPQPSARTPLRWPGRLPLRQAYMWPHFPCETKMKNYGTINYAADEVESNVSTAGAMAESLTTLKKRLSTSPILLNGMLLLSALAVLLSLVTVFVLLFCLMLKDVDYHDLAFGMLLIGSLVLLLFAAGFAVHFQDDCPFRTALKMAFEETLALLVFCGLVGLSIQAVGSVSSWTGGV